MTWLPGSLLWSVFHAGTAGPLFSTATLSPTRHTSQGNVDGVHFGLRRAFPAAKTEPLTLIFNTAIRTSTMATTNFKGSPVNTCGSVPGAGDAAPDVVLTAGDLSDAKISSFAGSKVVLNIFPSIDTGVCAASVRKFNETAASLDNTKILCISRDLPLHRNVFAAQKGSKTSRCFPKCAIRRSATRMACG